MVFSVSVMSHCSNDLEISRQLPIGDRLAEFPFFPLPGSGIVLDEGVAEQGARGFGGDQTFGGLIERRGQAPVRRMFAVVGVPFDGRIRLDAMLDSPKPGADGCG